MEFDIDLNDTPEVHAAKLAAYMRQGAQMGEHAGNVAADWSDKAQELGMTPDETARIRRLAFDTFNA